MLVQDKTIVFFHDESTFQSNDDQPTFWGTKGTHVMRPKSKGAGIMVTEFISERGGYLALTEKEHEIAMETDPSIRRQAREFHEYGESKEGYWTSDKFMNQMEMAVRKADRRRGLETNLDICHFTQTFKVKTTSFQKISLRIESY